MNIIIVYYIFMWHKQNFYYYYYYYLHFINTQLSYPIYSPLNRFEDIQQQQQQQ